MSKFEPILVYSSFCDNLCSQCPTMNRNDKRLPGYYGEYKAHKEEGKWDRTLAIVDGIIYYQDLTDPVLQSNNEEQEKSSVDDSDVIDFDDFEEYVARKYLQVKANAKRRGKEFDITLTSIRNILKAKKCFYSGIELAGPTKETLFNTRTIDRKDPTKGYVKGNIVACAHSINQHKKYLEYSDKDGTTLEHKIKMMKKLIELYEESNQ